MTLLDWKWSWHELVRQLTACGCPVELDAQAESAISQSGWVCATGARFCLTTVWRSQTLLLVAPTLRGLRPLIASCAILTGKPPLCAYARRYVALGAAGDATMITVAWSNCPLRWVKQLRATGFRPRHMRDLGERKDGAP